MIMRMRCARIVILGDIEKAFLQLRLHEKDCDVTRFLWFKDPHRGLVPDNIVTYRFNRVLFGVISSPFLLAATIRYHMEKENTPVALEIRDSIYSDNVLLTADTTDEAINKCEEAKKLFQTAGMNLCQFQSNDAQINKAMADGNIEELSHFLGVPWCIEEDCLKMMTVEPDQFSSPLTKRGVLSTLSSNFDPLGFLVPVLIKAKAFFQGLWKQQYDWDKKLESADERQWFEITKDWGKEAIQLKRMVTVEGEQVYELHVFVDASLIACAAAVYLVCIKKGKVVAVNLVYAKSRLSPTKQITIPRLELTGVIIGIRALYFVREELRKPISQCYLWCDSKCVLAWIASDPSTLQVFVRNRVLEIQKHSDCLVGYVATDQNPADLGTKGCGFAFLRESKLWWSGPVWLNLQKDKWPNKAVPIRDLREYYPDLPEDVPDKRVKKVNAIITPTEEFQAILNPTRFSKYQRLIRATAFTLKAARRFLHITGKEPEGFIQRYESKWSDHGGKEVYPSEMKIAYDFLIRHDQLVNPPTEQEITRWNLYKNNDGFIVTKDRLGNSDLVDDDDERETFFFSRHSHVLKLIVWRIHEKNMHSGLQQTLAALRRHIWCSKSRAVVKHLLHQCQKCRVLRSKPYKLPPMPALPKERVSKIRPFAHIGLDFLGPTSIKVNSQTEKRWICLFTCMVTRACHLEICTDLSAKAFINAFRRFCARRSKPSLILSDNATNFTLAAKMTTNVWVPENDAIKDYMEREQITWRFIPKLTPYFGGFYERLVALVKKCYRMATGRKVYTEDEANTVITEVEQILNERPLTYIYEETGCKILRPVDFINPEARETGIPFFLEDMEEPEQMEDDEEYTPHARSNENKLRKHFQKQTQSAKQFWKLYREEYLNLLKERDRLHHKQKATEDTVPHVGDVVLVHDVDLPKHLWPQGVIEKIREGHDKQRRIAVVRMSPRKTLTRPISKLYVLELNKEARETTQEEETAQEAQRINDSHVQPEEAVQETVIPEWMGHARLEEEAPEDIDTANDDNMVVDSSEDRSAEQQAQNYPLHKRPKTSIINMITSAKRHERQVAILPSVKAMCVNLMNPDMKARRTILLDPGSQYSFITNKLARELKLTPITRETLELHTAVSWRTHRVECLVYNIFIPTVTDDPLHMQVYAKQSICDTLDCVRVERAPGNDYLTPNWNTWSSVVSPQVLLGCQYYWDLRIWEQDRLSNGLAVLSSTLGYLCSGNMKVSSDDDTTSYKDTTSEEDEKEENRKNVMRERKQRKQPRTIAEETLEDESADLQPTTSARTQRRRRNRRKKKGRNAVIVNMIIGTSRGNKPTAVVKPTVRLSVAREESNASFAIITDSEHETSEEEEQDSDAERTQEIRRLWEANPPAVVRTRAAFRTMLRIDNATLAREFQRVLNEFEQHQIQEVVTPALLDRDERSIEDQVEEPRASKLRSLLRHIARTIAMHPRLLTTALIILLVSALFAPVGGTACANRNISILTRIHGSSCTGWGTVVYLDTVSKRYCFKEHYCQKGHLKRARPMESVKAHELCDDECQCPVEWAKGCSHYFGKEILTSTVRNDETRAILRSLKPEVCSMVLTAGCPVVHTTNLFAVLLYDGSLHYVEQLQLIFEEYNENDIMCHGYGNLTSGTDEYCSMNDCNEEATRYCHFPYGERVLLYSSRTKTSTLIRAWGSLLVNVYWPKRQTPHRNSSDYQFVCEEKGFSVQTNLKPNLLEICSGQLCQKIKDPVNKVTSVVFPKEYLLSDHQASLTAWELGVRTYESQIECTAKEHCLMIECKLCKEFLVNLHCMGATDSIAVIAIFYGFLITVAFIAWIVYKKRRRFSFELHSTTVHIEAEASEAQARENAEEHQCAEEEHRSEEQRTDYSVQCPFIRRQQQERRLRRHNDLQLRVISTATIFICLATYAHACSDAMTIVADTRECHMHSNRNLTCSYTKVIDFSVPASGQTTCLLLKSTVPTSDGSLKTIPSSTLIIEAEPLYYTCVKGESYWTRPFKFDTVSTMRCSTSGSCNADVCQKTKPSDKIWELEGVSHESGYTGCTNGCTCWGCGCFFCWESCIFYKTFPKPTTDAHPIAEVHKCIDWKELMSVKLTLKQQNRENSTQIVLSTGITQQWDNLFVKITSISVPPVTPNTRQFVSAHHQDTVAIVPATQDYILQCPTIEKAILFKCNTTHNPCDCKAAGRTISCNCPYENQLISDLNNPKRLLPQQIGNTWYTHKRIGKGRHRIVAEPQRGVVSLRMELAQFNVETKVDDSTCRFAAAELKGCSSCRQGAQLNYTCTTDFGSVLGHVHCPSANFTVHCNTSGIVQKQYIFTEKRHIQEECELHCPNNNLTFTVQGRLLAVNLQEGHERLHISGRSAYIQAEINAPHIWDWIIENIPIPHVAITIILTFVLGIVLTIAVIVWIRCQSSALVALVVMALMQPGIGGVHPDSDDEFIPEDPCNNAPDDEDLQTCKEKDIGIAAAPYDTGPIVKLSDLLPLLIECDREDVSNSLLDPGVRTEILDWLSERMVYMEWSLQRTMEDGPHIHRFSPTRITMLGANQCLPPPAFREYPSFDSFLSFAGTRVPKRMLAHPDWQIFTDENDDCATHPERILVHLKANDPVPHKQLDAIIPAIRDRVLVTTTRRQLIPVLMERFGWSQEELRQSLGRPEPRLAMHRFLQSQQLVNGQRNRVHYGYISMLTPYEVVSNVRQSLESVAQWYENRAGPSVVQWPVIFDVHGYRYPLNRVFAVLQ